MSTIKVEQVGKVYPGDTRALEDVNLEIHDGEFMVLVGPSGCGKSTLLRMLAGLESITEGVVRIDDQVVNGLPPKQRNVAMVFQNYALYPHMTVAQNLGFGLKLQKEARGEIRRRVAEAGKLLQLEDLLERKPKALSGGQRQRVAIGRAIVREPKAFLMDEPLSNLDAKLRVEMRSELSDLQRRLGTTTVYVTHDQVEAMTMGDRVAVLRKGRVQQVAAPRELFDHPVNLFVAGFIGSPAMNFVYATLCETADGASIEFGGVSIGLHPSVLGTTPSLRDRLGQQLIVGMRPAAFSPVDSSATPDLEVTVDRVEQLGDQAYIHFELPIAKVVTEQLLETYEDADDAIFSGNTAMTALLTPEVAEESRGGDFGLNIDTARLRFFDRETGLALQN